MFENGGLTDEDGWTPEHGYTMPDSSGELITIHHKRKDISFADSASPVACTIFCCLSCFARSTTNWALWASCWAT